MIQLFVFAYLAVMLFVGFRSSKRINSASDYYVAGKRASTWQVTGSLLATVLGSSALLGTANLTTSQGWAASWMILVVAIGFLALLPFATKVYSFGKFTLPELLGQFYGDKAKYLASVAIPIAWIGIVAAQIIGAAKLLHTFADFSYEQGVYFSGLLFIADTVLGGQVSIIKTDFIQSALILGGICTIAVFLLCQNKIEITQLEASAFPFNKAFHPSDLLILLLTYSSTIVVGPDIYSRIFCASSGTVAKKAVRNTMILLLPIAFFITYLGIYANNQMEVGQSEQNANIIYFLVSTLPNWASALFIAALFSAVVSSADTTLLSAAIICTDPITKGLEHSNSLKISRILVVVLGVLSLLFALKVTSIIQALLIALSFYSGAFIIPTLFGLIGIKTNKKTAILAMIIGGMVAVGGKLYGIQADRTIGNWIIVSAFAINATLLLISRTNQKR